MNPHQAVAHLTDAPYLGPSDRDAAKALMDTVRKQTARLRHQAGELRRLDAAIARRNEHIAALEARLTQLEAAMAALGSEDEIRTS